MTAEAIASRFDGRRSGKGWILRCPAHEADGRRHTPSASLEERGGKILVHCHAGCPQDAIIAALRDHDLWPRQEQPVRPWWAEKKPRLEQHKLGPVVAEYIYRDEVGAALYRVTRHDPKTFRQWKPDGHGGWKPGMDGVRRVPYRLREVIKAAIVFCVEGEKDAETLVGWGLCATCNSGGANKWDPEFARYFRAKTVILVPDQDQPGLAHAAQVAANLISVASQMAIIDLAPYRVKDITEWFERGHSEVELMHLVDAALEVE